LANGIIDLTAAEGLADLLAAETELQRKVALRRADGELRRTVESIRDELLGLAASVELAIDYVDEDEGEAMALPPGRYTPLITRLDELLDSMPAERLRDGVRVVVAGPPNAGKSSLINSIAREERAIVTAVPGTTRDIIEVPLVMDGIPILLTDTAGLRETDEPVERIGIDRARRVVGAADLVLWLGDEPAAPAGAILVAAKADLVRKAHGIPFSAVSGEGREALMREIVGRARQCLPTMATVALTARERAVLSSVAAHARAAQEAPALEVAADALRKAREELDRVTGRSGVEDLLDALFSRFCVGK
jgi:tRNA modification GTPase